MEYRIERDTMGEISVPADHLWGAQTQRSLENFRIGTEKMPRGVIRAFAALKHAAADVNCALGKLDSERAALIADAADAIASGSLDGEFPLAVWQTGSGTQTNMNVNEVIAHYAAAKKKEPALHPNDHVNLSQSSNDTFPTAMHIAAVLAAEKELLPPLDALIATFRRLKEENRDVIKIGRTHLQDAVPLRFSDEISGWEGMLATAREMILSALGPLRRLAIGGTAVGTGLHAPKGFDKAVCDRLSEMLGTPFFPDENKFHALTSKDAFVFAHGALKALAANLFKIANDIRLLAGGPRCGLGEITIPQNEPGSSIMPGKVNPTQCEAVTMVAAQVMGNDAAIGFAASQGQLQLNVFLPVIAHDFLQSVTLLGDVMTSFDRGCAAGILPNREVMKKHLDNSLMLVTALTPLIGYDRAAQAAKYAHENGISLRDAVLALDLLTPEAFDMAVDPEKLV